MEKYNDTTQDLQGNGITNASIYIYNSGTGTLSTILKDDEITALSNPITSADTDNYDSNGNYGFKAANGIYDIKIVSGSTTWKYDVVLFDSTDGASFSGDVHLADNAIAYFGTGNDLRVYHDGTTSRIKNYTGSLILDQNVASAMYYFFAYNSVGTPRNCATFGGATPNVKLYYDNSLKLETSNTGISVTGDAALIGHVFLQDAYKTYYGTGLDAYITHNGSSFNLVNTPASASAFNLFNQGSSQLTNILNHDSVGTQKTSAVFGGTTPVCKFYGDGTLSFQTKASSTYQTINFPAIPTSATGLSAGDVWSNSGVLTIV